MARWLHVDAGGIIRNIVEWGAITPPDKDDLGWNIVAETPQGSGSVGGSVVLADLQKDRVLDRIQQLDAYLPVIAKELFRLTNEVRTLQALATLTPAQYRAFLKTQL